MGKCKISRSMRRVSRIFLRSLRKWVCTCQIMPIGAKATRKEQRVSLGLGFDKCRMLACEKRQWPVKNLTISLFQAGVHELATGPCEGLQDQFSECVVILSSEFMHQVFVRA